MLLAGLPACTAQTDGVTPGVYLRDPPSVPENLLSLELRKDGEFVFVYSVLSSYLPTGRYEVRDSRLLLTPDTVNEPITYVFEIDGDRLTFLQGESTPLPDFASSETGDGAVFVWASDESRFTTGAGDDTEAAG